MPWAGDKRRRSVAVGLVYETAGRRISFLRIQRIEAALRVAFLSITLASKSVLCGLAQSGWLFSTSL